MFANKLNTFKLMLIENNIAGTGIIAVNSITAKKDVIKNVIPIINKKLFGKV
jgi:hypothetical protein